MNFNNIPWAWITGFIDGEGNFQVSLLKNNTMSLGIQVQLSFLVTQHVRDLVLLQHFVPFFGGGTVTANGPDKYNYRLRAFDDFEKVLFPLLKEQPLLTQKRHDAADFMKRDTMMKDGLHLTQAGLDQIRLIKAGMNRKPRAYI